MSSLIHFCMRKIKAQNQNIFHYFLFCVYNPCDSLEGPLTIILWMVLSTMNIITWEPWYIVTASYPPVTNRKVTQTISHKKKTTTYREYKTHLPPQDHQMTIIWIKQEYYRTTTGSLQKHHMTTIEPPMDHHMTIEELSHDHWRTTTGPLKDCHIAIEGPSHDHWKITTWPLKDHHITIEGLSHDHWRTITWPLKDHHMTIMWLQLVVQEKWPTQNASDRIMFDFQFETDIYVYVLV